MLQRPIRKEGCFRRIDVAQTPAARSLQASPAIARAEFGSMSSGRVLRWALVAIAVAGLAAGTIAYASGRADVADLCFTLATLPVIAGLAVAIVRDLLSGRLGVDAIALVSMSAAIA